MLWGVTAADRDFIAVTPRTAVTERGFSRSYCCVWTGEGASLKVFIYFFWGGEGEGERLV